MPKKSKHTEAEFSPISTDLSCLRVAQIPKSPKVAIFVPTTTTDVRLLYPLRMRAGYSRAHAVGEGAVVDDLYLLMLGHQLCAWEESTWPEVGKVILYRRVLYTWPTKHTIQVMTFVELAKGIEAYWSQFFANFDRFIVLTCLSDAYIYLEIWLFLCRWRWRRWQQTKQIALPLAHACRVIIMIASMIIIHVLWLPLQSWLSIYGFCMSLICHKL